MNGDLPSPQKLGTMELFDIRITGTGASYRAGLQEYVWRDPSLTLTDEFLARCNGLPVIWEHPEAVGKLNSEEFGNRVIGSVMLPYIREDAVHAIVRVYDEDAIKAMKDTQLSTSPGVVFAPSDGNESFKLPNGDTLLIEGIPSLLDHVAICEQGVWDKGRAPTGVLTTALNQEESHMAEKSEENRDDTAAKLDAAMSALDSMAKRLDSYEAADKARKDAEESAKKEAEEAERADKARKDAAEAEESAKADKARRDAARKDRFGARKDGESDEDFKKRFDGDEDAARKDAMEDGCDETVAADRARKDRKDAETAEEKRALEKANEARDDAARKDAAALSAENADLKARLAAVESFMQSATRDVPMAERNALAAAQHRADSVAALFGERAPQPIAGEASLAYRRRLLDKFKSHSARFKDSRLDAADAGMIEAIEGIIYNDAATAARQPAQAAPGVLIPMQHTDPAGRTITTYAGDIGAFMAPFMATGQVGYINRNPKGA